MNLLTKSLAIAALGIGLMAAPATAKADSFQIAYNTGPAYRTVRYVPDRGYYRPAPVYRQMVYRGYQPRYFGHPVGYNRVVYRGHPGKGYWRHDRRVGWR